MHAWAVNGPACGHRMDVEFKVVPQARHCGRWPRLTSRPCSSTRQKAVPPHRGREKLASCPVPRRHRCSGDCATLK
jgi:hypothetical protein